MAKLIEWLLSRFPTQTYCAVLGLVVASPVAILLRTDMTGVSWLMILISLVTFCPRLCGRDGAGPRQRRCGGTQGLTIP